MKRLICLLILLCFVPPCESRAQCTEEAPCPELARLVPAIVGGGVTAAASNPITFVAAAGTDIVSTDGPTINYPTVQSGDIMLCVITTGSTNAMAGAPPSDGNPAVAWTKITSLNDATSDTSTGVWWKRAGASEPASTVWTGILSSGAESGRAIVIAYRYCKASGDVVNTYDTNSNAAGQAMDVGTVTTTVANCMLVAIMGADPTDTSEFTFDAGGTTRINRASTPTGLYTTVGLIDVMDQIKAATGEITISGDYNEDEASAGILIALEPAS